MLGRRVLLQTELEFLGAGVSITPADKLNDLEQVIFDDRDSKLEAAGARRAAARQAQRQELAGCLVVSYNRPLGWAEDTALLRRNRSADPVAETKGARRLPRVFLSTVAKPSGYQTGPSDRHQSVKPSRHDAATVLAGCAPAFANVPRPRFQFTLNQYSGPVGAPPSPGFCVACARCWRSCSTRPILRRGRVLSNRRRGGPGV
jgi:hypothetical protein